MDAILLDLRQTRRATELSPAVLAAIKAIFAAALPEDCDYIVVFGLDTERHSLSNLDLEGAKALATEFVQHCEAQHEVERVQ